MQFEGNFCDYFKVLLHVVLCGCDTWFLVLRQEHILRVFENEMLSKTFRHKRKEIIGDWMKLDNDDLHILYLSPNIVLVIKSERMRQVGHVSRIGARRDACRVLVWKPVRKRHIGRPRLK